MMSLMPLQLWEQLKDIGEETEKKPVIRTSRNILGTANTKKLHQWGVHFRMEKCLDTPLCKYSSHRKEEVQTKGDIYILVMLLHTVRGLLYCTTDETNTRRVGSGGIKDVVIWSKNRI